MDNKTIKDKCFWAYLAGLVDGDGCIYIYKQKRGTKDHKNRKYVSKSPVYISRLRISNTVRNVFDFLVEKLGGTIQEKPARGNKVLIYSWGVQAKKATEILKAILPYLIIKPRQAEIIIELDEILQKRNWQKTPPEITKKREKLYRELKSLHLRKRPK